MAHRLGVSTRPLACSRWLEKTARNSTPDKMHRRSARCPQCGYRAHLTGALRPTDRTSRNRAYDDFEAEVAIRNLRRGTKPIPTENADMPIISIVVTIIVVGVLLWAANSFIPMDSRV